MKINKDLDVDLAFYSPDTKRKWCEEPMKDQPHGWRASRGYGNSCQRHGFYIINGKTYCRQHAGGHVLDILMKDHPTLVYHKSNQPAVQKK